MRKKHAELVSKYLDKTSGYGIYDRYPDISDRSAWESLSDDVRTKLISAGEEAQKEPWTQLLISDFLEFSKSGNRVRFEDKYFPRRRKLNKLVMAECVENKGRFLDDILDGLYLILDETTWCLPPHTSYERDAKQETLPDVTRQIIDLFQAESGAEVAFCEYLLRPVFEKVSPHISIYVNERLRERIFKPYENTHFWWMGDGVQTMCNWTPWIVQNVLICYLTRPEMSHGGADGALSIGDGASGSFLPSSLLEKAAKSLDYFLDEYGEDGGCNEGAQYYSHAGLCLFGCLELMDYATRSRDDKTSTTVADDRHSGNSAGFHSIYQEKKIRNIANFIVKMYVGGGYYVNFADCSALPGRRTAREFLFGKAIDDEVLASFAAEDFRSETDSEKLISEEINLFYHVMQAFAYDEMMAYPKSQALPEDSWYESMGLMVARNQMYTLAAKAGNNGDSHNHNDVGSFTIYKNGAPFVIDLGVGTYTQKTFSDKRYELWTMQSQFHNVPTFFGSVDACEGGYGAVLDASEGGYGAVLESLGKDSAADANNAAIIMQKDGAEYAARDVSCILCTNTSTEAGKAISSLKMEISGAYGAGVAVGAETAGTTETRTCAEVGTYTREVSLHKGNAVTVQDSYSGDRPFAMSIMTYDRPELAEDGACKIIRVGNVGEIHVSGPVSRMIMQEYPITDQRLATAWKHSVYRILLAVDAGPADLELKFV